MDGLDRSVSHAYHAQTAVRYDNHDLINEYDGAQYIFMVSHI